MKPAAFFFDLDGTLIDTESAWARAMVDYVRARGGETTVEELLPQIVGRNWFDIHATLHAAHPELGDTTAMEDAVILRGYYAKYAGAPEEMRIESTIAFFKKVSALAPCGIVSGSPHDDIVAAAKLCGISDRVRLILGAGEYEKGKPSPSGYLKAAEILGVSPADCVVIEDSTVGVQSGVAAGMRVIALDRGASTVPQNYEGATWRVKDLSLFECEKEFA